MTVCYKSRCVIDRIQKLLSGTHAFLSITWSVKFEHSLHCDYSRLLDSKFYENPCNDPVHITFFLTYTFSFVSSSFFALFAREIRFLLYSCIVCPVMPLILIIPPIQIFIYIALLRSPATDLSFLLKFQVASTR